MQKARRQAGRTIALRPLVSARFQVLFHFPNGGSFHLSLTLLCAIGHQEVFSLTGWSPRIHTRFHGTGATRDIDMRQLGFAYRTITFCGGAFQNLRLPHCFVTQLHLGRDACRSHYPPNTTAAALHARGLGYSHFARRYYGNRGFFLFLGLLRCFSSPRSLDQAMDSPGHGRG